MSGMSGSGDHLTCTCTCTCGTLIRMIERGEPVDFQTPCPGCAGTTHAFGATSPQVIDLNQSVEARSFQGGRPHSV